MIATHISTEPDPGSRGLEFGRRNRRAVGATVAVYERLFEELHGLTAAEISALGEIVGAALAADHPDVVTEIAAIADGAGVGAGTLLAVNARTEIFAGAARPECSVVGVLPERAAGATVLAQNWDWHPDVAGSRVLWTVVEPDGRSFTTLTEAGILAKVGLNDRGLGLCLNILAGTGDGGVGGVPVHVLCRLILQRGRDLEDVETILERSEATASSCLNVARAGRDGSRMRSYELSPAGVAVVEPSGGVLLHTNHFLADLPAGAEDRYRRDWPDTVDRLRELDERVRDADGELDDARIKAWLRSHDAGPPSICCHDAENPEYADRQATLASVFFSLEQRRFEITDGAPCLAPFAEVGVAGRGS